MSRARAVFIATAVLAGIVFGFSNTSKAEGWTFLSPRISTGNLCVDALSVAARRHGVPYDIMAAISLTESGRRNPQTKTFEPWPWTLNIEGKGYFLKSKEEAIRTIEKNQSEGRSSIDVGCFQINLRWHPDAFDTLTEGLDPFKNADYAARFLLSLKEEAGTWTRAIEKYHSRTHSLGKKYRQRVESFEDSVAELRRNSGPGTLWGRGMSLYGIIPSSAHEK